MNSSRVRASLCDYLDREVRERVQLRTTLVDLAVRLPETVIFGGMLREFACGRARHFRSDIDLVSQASRSDIFAVIKRFEPVKNKFGGFRFLAGSRVFDLWSLEDTWAFREGLVSPDGFEALLDTTFFGVDSAVFHLSTRKYFYSEAHLRGARDRVLELNLQENPSPRKMAIRAVSMSLTKDLGISHDLALYVLRHQSERQADALTANFLRALAKHVDRGSGQPFRYRPETARIPALQDR